MTPQQILRYIDEAIADLRYRRERLTESINEVDRELAERTHARAEIINEMERS